MTIATLSMLLHAAGHVVRISHDGKDALTLATSMHPDVILLDLGLPGMDGFEIARRIRNELRLTKTLLVAITGYGQDDDRRKSSDAGFDVHLVKPVDPQELERVLKMSHDS